MPILSVLNDRHGNVQMMSGPVAISNGRPEERRDTAFGRYLLQREAAFLSQCLSNTSNSGRLLDVCCGSGSVTRSFRNANLQVVGLDISPVALARFREGSGEASAAQGNALDLPFANCSFDYIVGIHCFDQLDRLRFLRECNRVLSEGGLLIFDLVNRYSYKWVLKRLHRCFNIRHHAAMKDTWIDVLSCDEVVQLVSSCAFEIQTFSGYSWLPFTRGSNSGLVDVMARAELAARLEFCYRYSPRVLVAARKSADVETT